MNETEAVLHSTTSARAVSGPASTEARVSVAVHGACADGAYRNAAFTPYAHTTGKGCTFVLTTGNDCPSYTGTAAKGRMRKHRIRNSEAQQS